MTASIIIPAHNEAAVIERCLASFAAQAGTAGWQVLVVCNGCTDDTAERAGRFEGVQVVEIAQASKVAALNAGDALADGFPRLYLDADITVEPAALQAVVTTLRSGAPAAAPLPQLDLAGCSLLSRAYFSVWSRLGYARHNLIGSGCYGLSEQGRGRFGRFPDLIADDAYVYSWFSRAERVNPAGAQFVIRPPRTLSATVHRRVRIVLGNRQLLAETGRRLDVAPPFWRDIVRTDPRLLPQVIVFLAVNLVADLIARRRLRKAEFAWNRDDSSRGGT